MAADHVASVEREMAASAARKSANADCMASSRSRTAES